MCTGSIYFFSFLSKNDVCLNSFQEVLWVSPASSPAVGEFLYGDGICNTSANDGWYIDTNGDPDVVFVVTGGNGEITSIESCSGDTTPTPTVTPTITPTPQYSRWELHVLLRMQHLQRQIMVQ